MRLFSAIELSNHDKRAIFEWRDRHLNPYLVDTSSHVASANFHITLAFFGDVAGNKQEQLCQYLDSTHLSIAYIPRTLTFDHLEFWPKTGICCLRPSHTPEQIHKLAEAHAKAGNKIGSRKSKHPYKAHITLARGLNALERLPAAPNIEIEVHTLSLFESQRNKAGQYSYHAIEQWQVDKHAS